jgi:flagellar biosynthesis protein FlhB
MTKQEVKEEHKQMEGDPLLRARMRERQRKIVMERMMDDVPRATVVITNPTVLAVALLYRQGEDHAPMVVAKGADLIAGRIRELAVRHNVPLMEDKLLARTLYYQVDVGQEIPVELYQAVAEILAVVYSLKK